MKRLFTIALLSLVTILAGAQIVDPVKFSTRLVTGTDGTGEIVFTGKIDNGWHVYSTGLGADGPISASFKVNKIDGAELVGTLQAQGKEIRQYDKMFAMTLRYFEHSVTFVQKVRFTKAKYSIDAFLEYGACSDQMCMPPTYVDFKKSGKAEAAPSGSRQDAAPATQAADKKGLPKVATVALNPDRDTPAATDTPAVTASDTVGNAVMASTGNGKTIAANADGAMGQGGSRSLGWIFLMGFVGGLLALVMPCIWPVIPMTVSFFLRRSKDNRRRAIREAMGYGLSIIVIYLALGIGVTAVFGPWTLNALSTNAVFNIFLFLLLVVFAVSFFGWFEIKLPDSWANKVDTKASSTTGILSIFLMAFTLVLVSFSCTAPIVGLLLVQTATSGDWLAPAVGMFAFALALAIPFSLFAMFPTLMKKSPKSGAWMNQIKVVLGFIELAFSLKFFSVADLAYGWHLMDREVFLSLWIVIFGMLGAYLVGWLKFPQDAVDGSTAKPMPVPAIILGLCSFAFAIYMIPGLWGAPCKAVSAFAPPMTTQDFNLNSHVVEARYKDYDAGMAAAKAEGKPVMIDFTGFGCVNCRKMEASVWTDPRVADKLTKEYVLISLYVDDKTALPKPVEVRTADGKTRTLRTVGDKWSFFQAQKFGANAQPYYVTIDNNGSLLSGPFTYKEDVSAYLDFLNRGLERYGQRQ